MTRSPIGIRMIDYIEIIIFVHNTAINIIRAAASDLLKDYL